MSNRIVPLSAPSTARLRSGVLDWTVAHGLPDVDPILDASDAGDSDELWHHAKSSARMSNIVDGTALITMCGTRLGRDRPVVWKATAGDGAATSYTCPSCATIRSCRRR
jgi:hypothetical protein